MTQRMLARSLISRPVRKSLPPLLATLVFTGLPLAAQVVYDDFNDNSIDPSRWTFPLMGTGFSVQEANGQLEFHFAATASDGPSGVFGTFGAGGTQLVGDFDIQVDFRLVAWPFANGVRMGLAVLPVSGGASFGMERTSLGSPADQTGSPRETYITDSYGSLTIAATGDQTGTLRITRVGTTLTSYYRDSTTGQFVPSVSNLAPSAPDVTFYLSAWSHDYAFTDQPVTCAFDNIVITGGLLDTAPPTANAGRDQRVHASTSVVLHGEDSYDDTTATANLVYAWSFVPLSTPEGSTAVLANADTATPSFTPDLLGEYRIQLVVTDEAGNVSAPDEVVVSSENQAPTAVIHLGATVDVGQPTSLDGSGSSDPDGDPLTYVWSIRNEPTGANTVLVAAQTATPSFTPLVAGTYEFQLVVSDPFSASAPVFVSVVAITGVSLALQELAAASDYLAGMNDSDFAARGHRNFFRNNIRSACEDLQANDVAAARATIEKLIERTDGVPLRNAVDPKGRGNAMFAADFIEVGLHQLLVYQHLTAALAALQP